jgi:hypothetical protein
MQRLLPFPVTATTLNTLTSNLKTGEENITQRSAAFMMLTTGSPPFMLKGLNQMEQCSLGFLNAEELFAHFSGSAA